MGFYIVSGGKKHQAQSFIVQVETSFNFTVHLSDGHSSLTCWVGWFGCE